MLLNSWSAISHKIFLKLFTFVALGSIVSFKKSEMELETESASFSQVTNDVRVSILGGRKNF